MSAKRHRPPNSAVLALVCIGALALVGILRSPLEKHTRASLYEQKLLPPPLDPDARQKLGKQAGQRAAFLALGGMRSPIASWRAILAFTHFRDADWPALEREYDLITTLAPGNEAHWETGGWHLAYNAAGNTRDDESIRSSQRSILHRHYVEKGRELFLEGIEANPESRILPAKLANLYSDPNRYPDHLKAHEYYKLASSHDAPDENSLYRRFAAYALARVPGRELETYRLLRELWPYRYNRVPTVRALLFCLQHKLELPEPQRLSTKELFTGPRRAHQILSLYLQNDNGLPKNGIRAELRKIERQYGQSPEKQTNHAP